MRISVSFHKIKTDDVKVLIANCLYTTNKDNRYGYKYDR